MPPGGTGAALEALIRNRLKDYKAEGLSLEQNSPRFTGKVGPRGQAKGRLVSKGGLDFSGHFWGRAVTFDAKSTSGKSFPLNERNIKPHQVRRLREAHEMGAIAFFLVEFTEPDGKRASTNADPLETKGVIQNDTLGAKGRHSVTPLVEGVTTTHTPRYFVLTWPVLAPYWEAIDRARYVGGKAPASIPLEVFKRSCAAVVRDKSGLDLVAVIAGMAERAGRTV